MNASPDGLLVRIKDKLMLKLNIDHYRLRYLISTFVSMALADLAGSKVHYTAVNLISDLTKPSMTIKVFFKFLNIIRAKKVVFSITVTTVDNRTVTATEEIELSNAPWIDTLDEK